MPYTLGVCRVSDRVAFVPETENKTFDLPLDPVLEQDPQEQQGDVNPAAWMDIDLPEHPNVEGDVDGLAYAEPESVDELPESVDAGEGVLDVPLLHADALKEERDLLDEGAVPAPLAFMEALEDTSVTPDDGDEGFGNERETLGELPPLDEDATEPDSSVEAFSPQGFSQWSDRAWSIGPVMPHTRSKAALLEWVKRASWPEGFTRPPRGRVHHALLASPHSSNRSAVYLLWEVPGEGDVLARLTLGAQEPLILAALEDIGKQAIALELQGDDAVLVIGDGWQTLAQI
jgi:hypothetical protein